ncbi:unnamed protein product [Mytilus coruscus]|uniref:TIR domain-containing protein n=1 Tax=Mytilus coruscus TaxID=42192 RepID=A0A6J8CMC6_MYTCO|nr:unnamed protein product [Mytilus coruscus]
MKLNLMYSSDQTRVENRKIVLDTAKQKKHRIVHSVVDLMRTLMDNPLKKRRYMAYNIEKLENNIKQNPTHLNTLADLAVLYRNSQSDGKATELDDKINKILNSSDEIDIKEKAVCVLEQGYAVLFEEFTENELEAQQKMEDCFRLIMVEQSKCTSDVRRHGLLCRASKCMIDARRHFCLALDCKNEDSVSDTKKSGVELFEKGLHYLGNTSYPEQNMQNIHIWNFYYAMACNRMPDTKDSMNNPMGVKAVDCFWSVITGLSKDIPSFTIYRARSFAYIGHKLISTKEIFNASLQYSSLSNDDQFQTILKTPLSGFKYATNELPNDEVVLIRKGISLWLMFKYSPAGKEDENKKYLDDAAAILSMSITLNSRLHLPAFSTRMNVYFEMSSLNSCPIDSKKDLLDKALKDGKDSIKANLSERDVCKVAEICQRLAKFPKFYMYGPEAVLNYEYLAAALDYLNQCICAKGQAYFTAYTKGTIYYDMGEFRTATEWHKRAFLLSDYTLAKVNVGKLCLSILRLGDGSNVFAELIHTLTYIASKMQNLHFLNNLLPKCLWKDYFGKLWKFLDYLKSSPLTAKQVEIAEYLKTILCEKDFKTAGKVKIGQYIPFTRTDVEYALGTARLLPPAIELEGEREHVIYDYFVIMSQVNSGWIQCFLQQQLRTQMIDDDMTFTGCSDAMDYDSCSSLLETTNDGINKSRRSILVLSTDFLMREWSPLKTMITETLQRRPDFLLIILLENCDVPSEIDFEHLSYFDFTDDKKIPIKIQHLKLALLEN